MKKLNDKTRLDDKQYGLDVIGRFADGIAEKIDEIDKDLHYLREWIRVTQTDHVTLQKIREYKGKR